MGTYRALENSQEEPVHTGPVTHSKSTQPVVSEPNSVDSQAAHDIDNFNPKSRSWHNIYKYVFNQPYLISKFTIIIL